MIWFLQYCTAAVTAAPAAPPPRCSYKMLTQDVIEVDIMLNIIPYTTHLVPPDNTEIIKTPAPPTQLLPVLIYAK